MFYQAVNTILSQQKVKVDAKIHAFATRTRRMLWKTVAVVAMPLAVWGYHEVDTYHLEQQHQAQIDRAVATAVAEVETQAYGRFGVEVFTLATVLVGEAKGQPKEWLDIASAFFERADDPRWPKSLERVAKYRCEIDALCDRVPEYLDSEIGRSAIMFAREVLTAYYAGEFAPSHPGHSWATPAAADGHDYFEDLQVVAMRDGHHYFGDETFAPTTSIRPMPKPQSPLFAEQYADEIDAIVVAIAATE